MPSKRRERHAEPVQDTKIYRLRGGPLDGKIVFEPADVQSLRVPVLEGGGARYYGPNEPMDDLMREIDEGPPMGAVTYDLGNPADAEELTVDQLVSLHEEPPSPFDLADGEGHREPI